MDAETSSDISSSCDFELWEVYWSVSSIQV